MAEWQLTFNGKLELATDIPKPDSRPNLSEEVEAAVKEIRKGKHEHQVMSLAVNPDSLRLTSTDHGSSSIYQPIAKIIFTHTHQEGSLKRAFLFSFVSVDDNSRIGAPGAVYTCFTFKCKSEDEASRVKFAVDRTLSTTQQRKRPDKSIRDMTPAELENSIRWWNAYMPPLMQYSCNKAQLVSGAVKFQFQVDASLKAVTKIVRLTSDVTGEPLMRMLAEKFNVVDANLRDFAVIDRRDTGEEHMLEDDVSPLAVSLMWTDPCEGAFVLKRLPKGLRRVSQEMLAVARVTSPSQGDGMLPLLESPTRDAADVAAASESSGDTERTSGHIVLPRDAPATPTSPTNLGPTLPYCAEDEDLLLSVMIARQSGTGLGFKLTPSYLLQMCIAYCYEHQPRPALAQLLTKIATQISTVVSENPTNPEMLLFWACNIMKLTQCFGIHADLNALYNECARAPMEETLDVALKNLRTCSTAGIPLPRALTQAAWSTLPELRAVVHDVYRSLDANMNRDNLQEVVARITAAMPPPDRTSPLRTTASEDGANGHTSPSRGSMDAAMPPATNTHGDVDAQLQRTLDSRKGSEARVLLLDQDLHTDSVTDTDMPMTSTPAPHAPPADDAGPGVTGIAPEGEQGGDAARAVDALPPEWEELIDPETKHRFFANHITRQTSWTDPRDRLTVVELNKGKTGLGLGISGGKRLGDRLLLGIFVSSLVPDTAAAQCGLLREGDEILEVNGHSLIGVSRDGAIEFLKQVKLGDTVRLLVAQEPDVWTSPSAKPQLRHTAL